DEIIALMLPNDGLTVHRTSCRSIDSQHQQCLPVQWGDVGQHEFTTVCRVVVKPSQRAIFYCLSMLSDMKVNVMGFKTEIGHANSQYTITLQVRSLKHLELVLQSLNQLKIVEKVKRELR
ncbi:hypothetical protein OAT84_04270, partial [Gammaproteobacteria bacterium]|nr:hypothetical protein [Gammaproteobacteria bacterium]